MYIVKKILASFLLPPGTFVVLLMCVGAWCVFKKMWKIGIANLLIACSIWFLSAAPVSNAIFRSLEADFTIPKHIQGDVIILLSGGVNDEAPDMSGVGAPKGQTLSRILTVSRLYKQLKIPIIASGGRANEDRIPHAQIMRRFLMDLGIPAVDILLEARSRDTIENARFTREICIVKGYGKPILVTCAYHLSRAMRSFEKVGLKVHPFPAGYKSWENRSYVWSDYLPNKTILEETSTGIREYLGLFFYEFVY